MSKLKRHLSVVCSVLLVAIMTVMPLLTGCGNKKPDGPEAQCTVTFDKNTSHTTNTIQSQTVDNGKTIKQPQVFVTDTEDTNRFSVLGWYTSKDCKEDEKWNFADPVTKSMTLYASWQEKVKVEFYKADSSQSAPAADPSSVQWVVKGEKAEREDGLVGNYKLEGYFTDTACENAFDFNAAVNADTKLYLKYNSAEAYMFAKHLAAMTPGYDAYYIYESKYCPTHGAEVTGAACAVEGCTATLVDPATVTGLYCPTHKVTVEETCAGTLKQCPDCEEYLEEADIEEGKHKDCEAELEEGATQANVQEVPCNVVLVDRAGPIAAKQRPEGYYPYEISKHTQEAEGENEAFDYVRFDFGNMQQPYLWYNPLNIGIKGMHNLTIKYRNVGLGKKIRFYYVMAYQVPGTTDYTHSGGGVFAKYVDIDIVPQQNEWTEQTIDMGAKTISDTDGISEWGTADILYIFRFDYPYAGRNAAENTKPGESVLEIAEIKFWGNGTDYSAKDSETFKTQYNAFAEGAPEDENWTWSVDTEKGSELRHSGTSPVAYFPYGTTGNTLTATATEANEIDCDADTNKALTINYNNHGYGTSGKLTWKTSEGEGSKNVSLDARASGKTIYLNMAGEDTWTGTLESLTLTYTQKGVDNAITVNSITIDAPKPEDVAGFSFKYGKSGFTGSYNAEKESMVVDATGITKTAAEGGTVLDVNNAIVYKGFTVWYTQGATAATKLTLTYTDENGAEHSAQATLAEGTNENSASFTFLDSNNRSAMSGKIKNITLATDTGSILVTYVDFDFDTDPFFVMTKQGAADSNWANVVSTRSDWNGGCDWVFDSVKNAWQINYVAAALPHSHFGLTSVPISQLKDKKAYLVMNNATTSSAFNVYAWFTGSGGPGAKPFGFTQPTIQPEQRKMGEYQWTIVEVNLTGKGVLGDAFEDIYADEAVKALTGISFSFVDGATGNLFIRAIIFR